MSPQQVPAGLGDPGRAELFSLALRHGPVTRAQLAEWTGLDSSTVTRSLRPLIEDDYLREERHVVGRGRPVQVLSVNPRRHVAIGVKVAPTEVTGVITDLGASVLARDRVSLRSTRPTHVRSAIGRLVAGLIAAAGADRADVLGVGVGLSGHVDQADGTCRLSSILGWHDVPVRVPLVELLELPVVVENDANTLALAEHWFGQGRQTRSLAVVTLGIGVGCGLILDDHLHSGVGGIAGELGHLPLDPAGPTCSCGATGCLESLAGDAAICALSGCASVAEAMEAASGSGRGALQAQRAFTRAGDALGRGLAALCNLVNPELILVAGESAPAFPLLEPSLREALQRHAFSSAGTDVRIEVHAKQDDLWTRGAASLAIRAAVSDLATTRRASIRPHRRA